MTSRRLAIAAIAVALGGGVAGCSLGGDDDGQGSSSSDSGSSSKTETTRVQVVEGQGGGKGLDSQALFKNEGQGVVTVISLFGSGSLESIASGGGGGVGSGFVLNGEGEIATNAHVVTQRTGEDARKASEVYVEFADGNRVEAEIKGQDPNADVALLKIDPKGLTLRPLPLGSSADVQVGEPVAAIGSPFGERQSLSVGVVSAIDRDIQSLNGQFAIPGAIQTDAAINPGNSGGPLVAADGRVIGINQQIKTNSGGGEGVGFAVPVDVVKRSLGALRETGNAQYAFLGVSSVPLFPQLVDRFDLDVEKGAWVQEVQPGTPADRAGIRGGRGNTRFQIQSYAQGGDIITKVEGKDIEDANDLSAVVAQFQPGQEVTVEVHRGGETKEIKVKLGERPLSAPSGG
ncbi:MAG TPA: trypsin-like peptidase domain-containing protein [Solirubrobacteraceae bacterium]|nr:trypsin-like peptidase domain-containing protein [Solirubrobacteraceae bacterium]